MAICVAGEGNQLWKVVSINVGQHSKTAKKITEPKVLNMKWIRLALLALGLAVKEDISAVTHEPILVPRMI